MKKQIIIDVGATGFPSENDAYNGAIEQEIYLFEPLPIFYSKLIDKYGKFKNFHIFELALSNEKGVKNFYVTKKNNCSSLLEPNPENKIISSREDLKSFDIIQVQTDTLFNVLGHLEKVDFLKLDTQGSEYEVLEGAGNLLKKVKQIKCEVEFSQWYKGQKLAKDVKLFLENNGFTLYKERKSTNHSDYYFINNKFI